MAKNYVDFNEAVESSLQNAYGTTLKEIISLERA
jgi:hypothetical protein